MEILDSDNRFPLFHMQASAKESSLYPFAFVETLASTEPPTFEWDPHPEQFG